MLGFPAAVVSLDVVRVESQGHVYKVLRRDISIVNGRSWI